MHQKIKEIRGIGNLGKIHGYWLEDRAANRTKDAGGPKEMRELPGQQPT